VAAELSDRVDELVRALDGLPAGVLPLLGAALVEASTDGDALRYLGSTLRFARQADEPFVRLRLRFWLRRLRASGEDRRLAERLAGVPEAPWPAVRRALS